jgi:hypothetical protein
MSAMTAVDTFTITSGTLPPGTSMPATYGGTPATPSTFTVHVTPFGATTPSTSGTYSRFTITVTDSTGDQATEAGSITIPL